MTSNQQPLVVLGLDGPNNALLEEWLEDGTLPNLQRLRARGISGTLRHEKRFRNALCWDIFLTGREPEGTGAVFSPETYAFRNLAPSELEAPPFYAGLADRRICVFDLIAPIAENLDGLQVIGWGCELNAFTPASRPEALLDELIARHGADPKMETAYALDGEARGFRNPNIYVPGDLTRYIGFLELAIERRTAITLDLLDRGPWDLFLGVFPEVHTANHLFWHLSQPYPVPSPFPGIVDPLRALFRKVDASIGEIARHLGDDADMLVFAIDETGPNAMDLPSMALLPELLWRWSGNAAALLDGAAELPGYSQDYTRHWKDEIWAQRSALGEARLLSPGALTRQGDPLNWHPAAWYRQSWPEMRAFALPSVADGHIRMNMVGREARGIVPAAEFGAEIDRLCAMLEALIDPRSGGKAAARIIRTRAAPEDAPNIPPDLIVVWASEPPLDCIEHPALGRIGPAPYFRSGGHRGHGAAIVNRYILSGKSRSPEHYAARNGQLSDLPATILSLIGARGGDGPLLARAGDA